tara:strand:+ start:92 stop:1474 length:1383 start_codon:yes stop_codon:yes gene_type:complete
MQWIKTLLILVILLILLKRDTPEYPKTFIDPNEGNIVVVGAGPTGLTIAEEMGKAGYNVIVIDRNSQPGGCWRIDWENDLMTEHSVKVVFSHQNHLKKNLESFGLYDLAPAYGKEGAKIIAAVKRSLNAEDVVRLGAAIAKNVIAPYEETVEEWLKISELSEPAKTLIKQISLALAQGPSMPIKMVLDTMTPLTIADQPKSIIEQDKWMNAWADRVSSLPNVTYWKNTNVNMIETDHVGVKGIHTDRGYVACSHLVAAVPPLSLLKLLEASQLENAWDGVLPTTTQEFLTKSSYTGVGFQLHFDVPPQEYEKWWCRTCDNPWSIIALPVSEAWPWVTRKEGIVVVWSCVVVDVGVPVGGKYIHEMTPTEFVDEAVSQLQTSLGIDITPKFYTVHANLDSSGKIAKTQNDDAFGITTLGALPLRGKINNLWSVGPQNFDGVATIDKAMEAGVKFTNSIESI